MHIQKVPASDLTILPRLETPRFITPINININMNVPLPKQTSACKYVLPFLFGLFVLFKPIQKKKEKKNPQKF